MSGHCSVDDIMKMNKPDTYEFFYIVTQYLKTVPQDFEEPHVFFASEIDSNLTPFERSSIQFKIAAVSKSMLVGQVMLFLMRVIIDDEPTLVDCLMAEYIDERDKQFTLTDIVKLMAKDARMYSHHEMKDLYRNVKRSIDEIDLWTLDRIISSVKDNLDRMSE